MRILYGLILTLLIACGGGEKETAAGSNQSNKGSSTEKTDPNKTPNNSEDPKNTGSNEKPENGGNTEGTKPGNTGSGTTGGSNNGNTSGTTTKPKPPAGPKPVHFLAFGDSGTGSQTQYDVAKGMVNFCGKEKCEFTLLLGDNIYNSGVTSVNDKQWEEKFNKPYKNLNMPFYVSMGNHDYGGQGAGYEFSKAKHVLDYASKNQKWLFPATYYTFNKENVSFFALDTTLIFYEQDSKQRTFFAKEIKKSTATWKIAFGHHPYISNGRHGNAGTYEGIPGIPIVSGKSVKKFMEDIICNNIDVYVCGHDHNRQFFTPPPGCKTYFMISGAAAKTTEIKKSWLGKYNNSNYLFQKDTVGFAWIKVDKRRLTFRFLDKTGKKEFEKIISK